MKRKAGRPIGARVIEAMAILEREGALTYAQVAMHMDNVVEMNAHKYCVRGVGYGWPPRTRASTRRFSPSCQAGAITK